MWEDRIHHVHKFRNHLQRNHSALASSVVEIYEDDNILDTAIEENLVLELAQQYNPRFSFKKSVTYTAVILDLASRYLRNSIADLYLFLIALTRNLLRDTFKPRRGWDTYYHHMTICLGRLPDTSRYADRSCSLRFDAHIDVSLGAINLQKMLWVSRSL